MPREKDPMDVHVGQRLKLRRTMASLSQEKLAAAVGVSFQQIQKYENGTNRVGAGRLMTVSKALGVPVSWFFEGFEGAARVPMVAEDVGGLTDDVFKKRETIELLKAYYKLPEGMRRHVMGMVKGMQDDGSK